MSKRDSTLLPENCRELTEKQREEREREKEWKKRQKKGGEESV
jgi:hypothetical protein